MALYGKEFIAFTDYKPLCSLLSSDRLNGWLRWLEMKLQHWLVDIQYVPGEENGLAYALSREERKSVVKDGCQSGVGRCGGATSTTGRARAGNLKGSTPDEDQDKGTMISFILLQSH